MTANERVEYYERLGKWSLTPISGVVMNDDAIAAVEAFLGTLTYESENPVRIVD